MSFSQHVEVIIAGGTIRPDTELNPLLQHLQMLWIGHLFLLGSSPDLILGQSRITQDLFHEAAPEIAIAMDRNGRPATVGMPEDDMAAALPDPLEAMLLESSKDLTCGESRKPWAHTATFTWETATSS